MWDDVHPDADPGCPTCHGSGYEVCGAPGPRERAWCYCTPIGAADRQQHQEEEAGALANFYGLSVTDLMSDGPGRERSAA